MKKFKSGIEIEVLGDDWNQLFCSDECEKLGENGNCTFSKCALLSTNDGYPVPIRSNFCYDFFGEKNKKEIWRQEMEEFWINQEKEDSNEL